ncbi:MAG: ribosomal protein S18-alanine N-acetyltransferase [Bacilli bacterium]
MEEIKIFTKYVDNTFQELIKLFPEVFKNRNIEIEFANNPFNKYFILFQKNKIIGFLNIFEIYDKIEIVNINIKKEYQGKGYSKLLMDKLIIYSNNHNIKNITLEVNSNNSIAINLYKKYRFKEVAIRKKYYNGTDGILMERKMM